MVLVELNENEIKALDALMKDCKTDIEMGFILYSLKQKIFEAWKKDFELKQKELAEKLVTEGKEKKK